MQSMLLQHKQNKCSKGTECANMRLKKKAYEFKDNRGYRADSFQAYKIVERPFSGDFFPPRSSFAQRSPRKSTRNRRKFRTRAYWE